METRLKFSYYLLLLIVDISNDKQPVLYLILENSPKKKCALIG